MRGPSRRHLTYRHQAPACALPCPLQAKTDVATNSAAPKFLKDLRLPVENPLKDTLTVRRAQTRALLAAPA